MPLNLRSPQRAELIRLARTAPRKLAVRLADVDPKIPLATLRADLAALVEAAPTTNAKQTLVLAACWSRVSGLNEPLPARRREQLRLARLIDPALFGCTPAKKPKR